MTQTSLERPRRWAMAVLTPAAQAVPRVAVVSGHIAMVLLIASGEALSWVDYRGVLIAAPMLRAAHGVAGFLLIAALLVRLANAVAMRVQRLSTGRRAVRGVAAESVVEPGAGWLSATALLDAAWWATVLAFILSGVDRYVQLRYGEPLLPVLSPAAWWVLHRPLLPYLYTLLLIHAAIRGRILVRGALSYLYTP